MRRGCWADLVAVPVENLVPLPDGLADELGAVATDSVATAFHAVRTRGRVGEGTRVAIWGTGGLGLSAVGIARTLGAAHVVAVDPREEARAWALETGADEALQPDGAARRLPARAASTWRSSSSGGPTPSSSRCGRWTTAAARSSSASARAA